MTYNAALFQPLSQIYLVSHHNSLAILLGVKIGDLVVKKEIRIEDLAGRTLAVDAHNIIYQFLTTIRDHETGETFHDSKGHVTSHLSGLFYRGSNLMKSGLKLVFVFDGERPEIKEGTVSERRERKIEAQERLENARKEGNLEEVRKAAAMTARVTPEIIDSTKNLLSLMGIPHVTAPSEGEAQAAHMAAKGDCYAVVSQDADTLLFGAPRLVRNLSTSGKRKLPGRNAYVPVTPEIISLEDTLKDLGITRDQLIILGMLVGTDYNPSGVRGIGPKKALKLVKEEKTLDAVLGKVEWNCETKPEEIISFFRKPPVTDQYSVAQGRLDTNGIRNFLCDEHEFSLERVNSALEKLGKLSEDKKQSRLGAWLKK